MSSKFITDTRALIGYLVRDGRFFRSPVLWLALLASASRTAMIYVVNETAESGVTSPLIALVLVGVVLLSLWAIHMARVKTYVIVETLAQRIRKTLSEHLLAADVGFFQRREHGEVYTALTGHAVTVSQALQLLVQMIEGVLLIVFCLTYMFLQSWQAGFAMLLAFVLGVGAFFIAELPARGLLERAHRARVTLHDTINDMLRGFRELRLRQARRQEIAGHLHEVNAEVRDSVIASERFFSLGTLAGTASLSFLLVVVVLVLPAVSDADSVTVLQVITLALFIFAPIEAMIGSLPGFARAALALRQMNDVLADARSNAETPAARNDTRRIDSFRELELRGITTTLRRPSRAPGSAATDTFTMGPIDLTLYPGQSVFITGGNGMGKSTLLKILTGLRHAESGEIILDGKPVTRDDVSRYRSLFSAVFSEFYLFRRLYGLSEPERDKLQRYIEELGLAEGVSVKGDAFSSLSLSTGQMRRLALSIALAEERPIIVLDEFAADQDPARRTFFYDVLVPRLARAGHTVVAVTHDEHCFHKSDRVIRMEDGKIVSDTINEPAKAANE